MTIIAGAEDYVWGVDLSTKALDVAFVADDGRWQVNSCVFAPCDDKPRRLVEQMRRTERFADAMADHFPPLAVFVELPTGRHPSPWLTMSCGAVLTGLSIALRERYAHPVSIRTIAVSAWKKRVLGNGNASKDAVMAWAQANGYESDRQDGADALAVAAFGAHECGWRPRLVSGPGALAA